MSEAPDPIADPVADPAPETRASYDRVAAEYTRRIADELAGKPLDREWLARLADAARPLGPVADLGCGPGHVTRFLADQGVAAVGLDLSPGMIAEARRLNPDLEFLEGDMRALPWPDATLGGLAALYSILHLRRPQLPAAFREMCRVLKPGGAALIAFHIGSEDIHLDEWWDMPVRLDFRFFSVAEIEPLLRGAGFEIAESCEREPYEGVEHPSRRAYLMARRAG